MTIHVQRSLGSERSKSNFQNCQVRFTINRKCRNDGADHEKVESETIAMNSFVLSREKCVQGLSFGLDDVL
ncbi:hypothetical protein OUZ56_021182 [Daphnia magna]|uniref:Uncharacterized protein n=1 Tax=Daphnia magna TaxID=35525 RepID=A0ABQ9ZGM1_9CRUS|nr:hypothetical protein OUZ56_021182 [Daphnia magna]